mgnify:CR=1 FL=1
MIHDLINSINIFTHFPKCKDCPGCQATKTPRASCRLKGEAKPDDFKEPEKFADRITLDHQILNKQEDDGELLLPWSPDSKPKVSLIIQDAYSKFLGSYPSHAKAHKEIIMAVKRFLGPGTPALHAYSDNSNEIIAAMEEMGILHDTSTPYCPESNGVIERAGRRVKEGTSACLVQSGLNEVFWDLATMCYCFLRNVVDLLLDGETAWKKRFGTDYNGPSWLFGCEVLYKPNNPDDEKRIHKYGNKTLAGIFVGYH